MQWRKPPQELVEYLDSVIPDGPAPVEFRPMFGGPCYWSGGNMFAAIHQESMIVRLGAGGPGDPPAGARGGLVRAHGRPPDARVRRHPPQIVQDREAVRSWLAKGLAYAASLPPKERKPRKPRAAR